MNARPEQIIDHRNHDTLDNRKSNLRIATHTQNCSNKGKLASNNTSGYRGVVWDCIQFKWQARIGVNGRDKTIGRFTSKAEAAKAAQSARAKYFGEFAGAD